MAGLPQLPAPLHVKWPAQMPSVHLVPAGANGLPQPPQIPTRVLLASAWQAGSLQLGTPSPSVSWSGTPQPQTPGSLLFGSLGHVS